jgi:hypothetical protein
MPKLLETFDQLIRSSEIRSSDRFPAVLQIKTFACRIILGHTDLNIDIFLFCLSNMFQNFLKIIFRGQ